VKILTVDDEVFVSQFLFKDDGTIPRREKVFTSKGIDDSRIGTFPMIMNRQKFFHNIAAVTLVKIPEHGFIGVKEFDLPVIIHDNVSYYFIF
jgi:hypothetical protein